VERRVLLDEGHAVVADVIDELDGVALSDRCR
jgi:hypothetical protein